MDLTAGQAEALKMVDALIDCDEGAFGILMGVAGSGKALAFDQVVQTPAGPVPIADLVPGNAVMGADGNPVTVVGVFPQGFRQSYRVTFRDGSSVECDEEHLWAVWTHKRRAKKTKPIVMSLKDVVAAGLRFPSGPHKFSIPLCAPVQYEEKQFPIDPYLLGLLIGDGTGLGKTPALCLPESEIELVQAATLLLPPGMEVRVNKAPACPQWRLIDPTEKGNRLTRALRLLGLAGLKSPERYVPPTYLLGSIQQRYALLRGLMDTDGSCNQGNRTSFSTHSSRLADDVVTLVQSLGGVAIKSQMDKRGGWSVNVKTAKVPFALRRKMANWRFSVKNPPSRHIVSVVPTRICEHVCIKVNASDGLFLTNGYVVTHNTTLLKAIADVHGTPQILAPTGKAAIRVTEATGLPASTIHRWLYKATEDPKTGEPKWDRKPLDEIAMPPNGIVIIDEASMLTDRIWADIWGLCRTIGFKVLLVGDPFQLSPVKPDDKAFSALALGTPYRAQLTEVVRQALDNPIIRASMMIRQSEDGILGALDILPTTKPSALIEDFISMAPSRALVTWMNITRKKLNQDVRKALKRSQDDLEPGEPLLVMYNNYNLDRFNGEVVNFKGWVQTPKEQIPVRDAYKNLSVWASYGIAEVEGVEVVATLSPEEVFGRLGEMPPKKTTFYGKVYARDYFGYEKNLEPSHLAANFGYCLTCHKAQGSQWQDVMVVIEPGLRMFSLEGRRWIYTSLTRARKNARLCLL